MSIYWLAGGNMERISDYTVIDMEMTGLAAKTDKVTEIGAVRIRKGRVEATLGFLVNPGRQIPDAVVQLTGITNEMAAGGKPMDKAMQELLDFMGQDLIVGQNVNFDYSFLAQWCMNKKKSIQVQALDTLKIARMLLPADQPKKLESLCAYFGIKRENAHRALDDALETWQLFEKLQDLAIQEQAAGSLSEEAFQKALCPVRLFYKAKRQTPATPHQIEGLKNFRTRHGISDEVNWENLTRSEASRLMDRYYTIYGHT